MSRQGRSIRTVLLVLVVVAAGLWWWLRRETAAPCEARAEVANQASAASLAGGPRDRPELVTLPRKLAQASVAGTVRDEKGQPVAGARSARAPVRCD